MSGHIFHVRKSLPAQITRKVSNSKVNSNSVSVEIKFSFEVFPAV